MSWGESSTVRVNGVAYRVVTAGTGQPLLMLHGFTGSADAWQLVAPPIARHRRVIAVDLLGHGQTDAPEDPARYQMAPAVADLAAVLDQLGHETVDLLGYSMGGRLALGFALDHPDRVASLILESASAGIADPAEREARRRADDQLADAIERDGIVAFVDRWERLPLFATQMRLSKQERSRVREGRLAQRPGGLANSLRGFGQGIQPALHDRLASIVRPTVLIVGEHDVKFRAIANDLEPRLGWAWCDVAPRTGHAVHLESPHWYTDAVLDHLTAGDEEADEED